MTEHPFINSVTNLVIGVIECDQPCFRGISEDRSSNRLWSSRILEVYRCIICIDICKCIDYTPRKINYVKQWVGASIEPWKTPALITWTSPDWPLTTFIPVTKTFLTEKILPVILWRGFVAILYAKPRQRPWIFLIALNVTLVCTLDWVEILFFIFLNTKISINRYRASL